MKNTHEEIVDKIVDDYFIFSCCAETYKMYSKRNEKFNKEIYEEIQTRRNVIKSLEDKKYEEVLSYIKTHPAIVEMIKNIQIKNDSTKKPQIIDINENNFYCHIPLFLSILSIETLLFVQYHKENKLDESKNIAQKYLSNECITFCDEKNIPTDFIEMFGNVGYNTRKKVEIKFDEKVFLSKACKLLNGLIYEAMYKRRYSLCKKLYEHCNSISYFTNK